MDYFTICCSIRSSHPCVLQSEDMNTLSQTMSRKIMELEEDSLQYLVLEQACTMHNLSLESTVVSLALLSLVRLCRVGFGHFN